MNVEEVSGIVKKFVTHNPQILDCIIKEVTAGRPTAACQLVFANQMLIFKRTNDSCKSQNCDLTEKHTYKSVLDTKSSVNDNTDQSNDGKYLHDLTKQIDKENIEESIASQIPGDSISNCMSCSKKSNWQSFSRSENIKHEHKKWSKCSESSNQICTSCPMQKPAADPIHVNDIEDLDSLLPIYNFTRPSQYYLAIKQEQGILQNND